MVWGMSMADTRAKFSPDGGFEAPRGFDDERWRQRLNRYCREEMDEGRRAAFADASYSGFVINKFSYELGAQPNRHNPPLTPLENHEPPRIHFPEKSYRALGSLLILSSYILAIDEDLKVIIERFEPDVHRFFPLDLHLPNGSVYPKQYYTLWVGQYCESFVPDGEIFEEDYIQGIVGVQRMHLREKRYAQKLMFSRKKFDDRHLWRERRFNNYLLLFSDQLYEAIVAAGLELPRHHQMTEV